jgi:hypothetical protein
MDPVRFDRLTKSLSAPGTRRALVRLVLGLPLAGSLAALLEAPDAAAKRPLDRVRDRVGRKQDKRRNRNHDNNRKHNGGKGGKGGKGGGSNATPARPTECTGKPNTTCCGTAGHWCQRGQCVAIPDGTRTTPANCKGRCHDPDFPEQFEVCGVLLACPDCSTCGSAPNNCPGHYLGGSGPEGFGFYCTTDRAKSDGCLGYLHTECPNLSTQMCEGYNCHEICYVPA